MNFNGKEKKRPSIFFMAKSLKLTFFHLALVVDVGPADTEDG